MPRGAPGDHPGAGGDQVDALGGQGVVRTGPDGKHVGDRQDTGFAGRPVGAGRDLVGAEPGRVGGGRGDDHRARAAGRGDRSGQRRVTARQGHRDRDHPGPCLGRLLQRLHDQSRARPAARVGAAQGQDPRARGDPRQARPVPAGSGDQPGQERTVSDAVVTGRTLGGDPAAEPGGARLDTGVDQRDGHARTRAVPVHPVQVEALARPVLLLRLLTGGGSARHVLALAPGVRVERGGHGGQFLALLPVGRRRARGVRRRGRHRGRRLGRNGRGQQQGGGQQQSGGARTGQQAGGPAGGRPHREAAFGAAATVTTSSGTRMRRSSSVGAASELSRPACRCDHRLDHLAGQARVAEGAVPGQRLEVLLEQRPGAGPALVTHARGLGAHDGDQFLGGVVGEGDPAREPGGQARVGAEEALHLVGVAGHDDDHLVTVVLHQLQQRVHRFLAEVGALAARGEGVRLVDEQHAAAGPFEDLPGELGGVADVAADQVGAGRLDELAPLQDAELGQDLPVEAGDGGLAGAGRTGEDEVMADRGHRQSGGGPVAGGGDEVDQVRDVALHLGQADHVSEAGQRVVLRYGVLCRLRGGAGGDVLRQQQPQVALADLLLGGEPDRLSVHHLLEHPARRTAVAEAGVARHRPEVLGERRRGPLAQLVLVLAAHGLHDRDQFGHRVVLELDGPREAGGQTRVGAEEGLHLAGVAGRDHHHVVAVVLHQFQDGVHRLAAEVGAAVAAVRGQRVRLVDEQHAAERPLEGLAGLDRGTADDLRDQVGAGDLHQVPAAQRAQLGQDRPVQAGDRRLAGAGRTREDQVPAHRWRRHAELFAALGELGQVDQGAHLLLDVLQAYQRVQGAERAVRAVRRRRVRGAGAGRVGVLGTAGAPGVPLAVARAVQALHGEPFAGRRLHQAAALVLPGEAVHDRDGRGGLHPEAVLGAAGDLAAAERGERALVEQESVALGAVHRGAVGGQLAAPGDHHALLAGHLDTEVADGDVAAVLHDQAAGGGVGDPAARQVEGAAGGHAHARARRPDDLAVLDAATGVLGRHDAVAGGLHQTGPAQQRVGAAAYGDRGRAADHLQAVQLGRRVLLQEQPGLLAVADRQACQGR
ncbi:hypothetical protein QF026_002343 [Streptomyces aurantiacus]|nr:hypothetical protein [Streptomyces aurantiacus]